MPTELPFSYDLLTVWEEYRKAAKRSRQLKRLVNRSRLICLALLIAGAVLGVLADQSAGWHKTYGIPGWLPTAFALVSAISFAAIAFLTRHVLDSQYERQWVFARSQAEALKSEAYVYLVKAPPYDGDDRDVRLAAKTQEILGEQELGWPVQLNEEEKRAGLPENWLSMNDYLKKRVTEQIEGFYEPGAVENDNLLKRLRTAGFLLGLIGAALGAVSTTLTDSKWLAAWIAVIGTMSGALVAFTFAGRYQSLVTSYGLTARRLKWLRNAWSRLPDDEKPKEAGDFVRKFEDAISVENSSWVAEWTKKTEEQLP